MDTLIVYLIWLGVYCGVIGTAEMIAEKAMDKKKRPQQQLRTRTKETIHRLF